MGAHVTAGKGFTFKLIDIHQKLRYAAREHRYSPDSRARCCKMNVPLRSPSYCFAGVQEIVPRWSS